MSRRRGSGRCRCALSALVLLTASASCAVRSRAFISVRASPGCNRGLRGSRSLATGSRKTSLGRPRYDAAGRKVPRRLAEEEAFSRARLRSETADFGFSKTGAFLYIVLTIGAFISLFFALPRYVASFFGIKSRVMPVSGSNEADIVLGIVAAGFFGYLAKQEWDQESTTEQRMEEAELVAKLVVDVSGAVQESVQLGNLRMSKAGAEGQRRVVFCLGSQQFCEACLDAAAPSSQAINKAGFLLVPVPLAADAGEDAPIDTTALATIAGRASQAPWDLLGSRLALPKVAASDWGDWDGFCDGEVRRAREQQLDPARGLVVLVRTNGRIGQRIKGSPDWAAMAADAVRRPD
eukprot:TRINITY_DN76572_c0_g1_i1.p1 TRINITY_DN76572_c0_g1~~TRINITY_DN76572_c0_g1_i1.p1  ORF type:complete len:350 (+),score=52.86 TRINITY_DN76572_c0_g1_i1:78-1127(+)